MVAKIKVEIIHVVYPDGSPEEDRTEYGLLGLSDYRFKSRKEAQRVMRAVERAIQKVVKT